MGALMATEISTEARACLDERVVVDDIARIIWLATKNTRSISNTNLDYHCLNVSSAIKQDGLPESQEKFRELLSRKFGYGFTPNTADKVYNELQGLDF